MPKFAGPRSTAEGGRSRVKGDNFLLSFPDGREMPPFPQGKLCLVQLQPRWVSNQGVMDGSWRDGLLRVLCLIWEGFLTGSQ